MKLSRNTIKVATNISTCMSFQDIQEATWEYDHLHEVKKTHTILGWPSTGNKLKHNMRLYFTFRNELAIFDCVAMKKSWIIITTRLQHQADESHGHQKGETVGKRISIQDQHEQEKKIY